MVIWFLWNVDIINNIVQKSFKLLKIIKESKMTLNNCQMVSISSFRLLLRVHHMVLRLSLQVVVKRSSAGVASSKSILMVHVVHRISTIIVTILISFHIWILHVISLLVVANHVFHVSNSDAEDDINAVFELPLTEDLILVKHLEITA